MDLGILLAAATLAGCKAQATKDQTPNPPTSQPYSSVYDPTPPVDPRKGAVWQERPAPLPQQATPVAQGPTPLVHLFDVGGPIRVIDAQTNAVIATATVPDHALVRIDDRHGVIVGNDTIWPGPLPEGHQYIILVEPTTPGVMRQGIGPPATWRP